MRNNTQGNVIAVSFQFTQISCSSVHDLDLVCAFVRQIMLIADVDLIVFGLLVLILFNLMLGRIASDLIPDMNLCGGFAYAFVVWYVLNVQNVLNVRNINERPSEVNERPSEGA